MAGKRYRGADEVTELRNVPSQVRVLPEHAESLRYDYISTAAAEREYNSMRAALPGLNYANSLLSQTFQNIRTMGDITALNIDRITKHLDRVIESEAVELAKQNRLHEGIMLSQTAQAMNEDARKQLKAELKTNPNGENYQANVMDRLTKTVDQNIPISISEEGTARLQDYKAHLIAETGKQAFTIEERLRDNYYTQSLTQIANQALSSYQEGGNLGLAIKAYDISCSALPDDWTEKKAKQLAARNQILNYAATKITMEAPEAAAQEIATNPLFSDLTPQQRIKLAKVGQKAAKSLEFEKIRSQTQGLAFEMQSREADLKDIQERAYNGEYTESDFEAEKDKYSPQLQKKILKIVEGAEKYRISAAAGDLQRSVWATEEGTCLGMSPAQEKAKTQSDLANLRAKSVKPVLDEKGIQIGEEADEAAFYNGLPNIAAKYGHPNSVIRDALTAPFFNCPSDEQIRDLTLKAQSQGGETGTEEAKAETAQKKKKLGEWELSFTASLVSVNKIMHESPHVLGDKQTPTMRGMIAAAAEYDATGNVDRARRRFLSVRDFETLPKDQKQTYQAAARREARDNAAGLIDDNSPKAQAWIQNEYYEQLKIFRGDKDLARKATILSYNAQSGTNESLDGTTDRIFGGISAYVPEVKDEKLWRDSAVNVINATIGSQDKATLRMINDENEPIRVFYDKNYLYLESERRAGKKVKKTTDRIYLSPYGTSGQVYALRKGARDGAFINGENGGFVLLYLNDVKDAYGGFIAPKYEVNTISAPNQSVKSGLSELGIEEDDGYVRRRGE